LRFNDSSAGHEFTDCPLVIRESRPARISHSRHMGIVVWFRFFVSVLHVYLFKKSSPNEFFICGPKYIHHLCLSQTTNVALGTCGMH